MNPQYCQLKFMIDYKITNTCTGNEPTILSTQIHD